MNFQKITTITWRELVGLDSRMFLEANIIQKTVRVGNQKGVKGVSCRLGRSENQKSQAINNGGCFFYVLVYKEPGDMQLT